MKNLTPQIEFCMDLAVSEIVDILRKEQSHLSYEDVLEQFSKTETYKKIYDPTTRLWAEGSAYLIDFYREKG